MSVLIDNIAQLVAVAPGPVPGPAMRAPTIIPDAAVILEADRIAWFGPAAEATRKDHEQTIDARGGTVVPGLVDCHTHVVFAGSREDEFVLKIKGASYIEILEAGGGIRNSVRALRAASTEDLIEQARPRLRRMLEWGATTVEIKSGYGLSPEAELKTLRAIKSLRAETPIELVSTFLGAHTIPPEFDGRADEYLDIISSDELLATIRDERLAEFADVFCERGAFNVEQSRRFLLKCKTFGLTPKIHSEQITFTGATEMAVKLGAASADHLELIDDATIQTLKTSSTIPVILPGCSFFLHSDTAPARKLIDADLPVALATDCNPGSCMIESLPLIMSMGAAMLRMTPLECLTACTANAAAAIGRAGRIGAIAVGHAADLLILDIPNVNQWIYRVGVNPVRQVIKNGRIVLERDRD